MSKTVKELIEYLQTLPQDVLALRYAGGDCGGYDDIVTDDATNHWQSKEIDVYPSDPTNGYHGKYDDVFEIKETDFEYMELRHLGLIEAAKNAELPMGYETYWTLETWVAHNYPVAEHRAWIDLMRTKKPIKAILLR